MFLNGSEEATQNSQNPSPSHPRSGEFPEFPPRGLLFSPPRASNKLCSMPSTERWRLLIQGVVQGVGFRPFVYTLATRHRLSGFVSNNSDGVHIEIEGARETLETFRGDLQTQPPPLARIDSVSVQPIPTTGDAVFRIHE